MFTHREYFRRYRLNVEQYGEILVADAFRGIKLGDAQPGYDVLVRKALLIEALDSIGADATRLSLDEEVRIEVKSKQSVGASVVHCNECKIYGAPNRVDKLPMSHLAVVLVHPGERLKGNDPTEEGRIVEAWLMTRDIAVELRKKEGKTQYLRVRDIKLGARPGGDVISIRDLLERSSETEIQ
jgi:hypothetical protein